MNSRRESRFRRRKDRAPSRRERARKAGGPREEPGRAGHAPEISESYGAIFLCFLFLASLGTVMVFSTTAPLTVGETIPPHFLRHLSAVLVGGGLALVASRFPLRLWHRFAYPLWVLVVVLLVLTLVVGVRVNGAQRWLPIPGTGILFQPAELAKFATVMVVAVVLARREGHAAVAISRFGVAIVLAGVPAALCLMQPDLGNAVLLLGLAGLLLFVAGAPVRALAAPAVLASMGIAAYSLLNPYAFRRWIGFLDPWRTSLEQGYQLVQSFVAFGRGGLFGVGLGDGRQKLFYLPEAHTDFILAVIAEELGLVGVLLVLGAFAALLVAGVRIALRCRQRFAMLLAFGMTGLIAVPALVNAAVVMGLAPTKGLTLPFLSYGRSSLLVCCVTLGVLASVARSQAQAERSAGNGSHPRGLVQA
jgi:cell division protein FtsW